MKKVLSCGATVAFATAVAAASFAVAKAADTAPKITLAEKVEWTPMIPEMGTKGPAFSVVFGKPGEIGQPFGGLFKVPAGGESPSHTHTSDYWAVMVSGAESAREAANDTASPIPPGSWWFQPGKAPHVNKCMGPEECVFFVYYPNGMDYIPDGATK
ncbi:hypothetical protein D9M68_250760 [compost metagenome]